MSGKSSINRRVSLVGFGDCLEDILAEYESNVRLDTQEVISKIGDIAKKEVKAGAPVRTGRYKRGWTVRKDRPSNPYRSSTIVHNRTDYQLTHLLENGHVTRNGGRTKPIAHIAPVAEHADKMLKEAFDKIAEG